MLAEIMGVKLDPDFMKLFLAFACLVILSGCAPSEPIDISKPPGYQKKRVDAWEPRDFNRPDGIDNKIR